MEYRQQWQVPSSDGERMYTVSVTLDGQWQCSCVGWTRHVPRRDCRHIIGTKSEVGEHVRGRQSVSAVTRGVHDPRQLPERQSAPVKSADSLTTKAALKTGATPDEVAAVARIKREEVAAKKAAKLGKYRYGFQLAHTYEPSDLEHGEWVAEVKYDGELAMLIDGRLVNRSGNDVTHRFPEIAKPAGVVLVGEVCIFDEATGLTVFNKVQERSTDDELKIALLSKRQPATFVAFDMLEAVTFVASDMLEAVGMDNLTDLPFDVRRRNLEAFFRKPREGMKLAEQIPVNSDRDVQALVKKMAELGGEGFMLKRLDAPYIAKRGRNWVKAKTWQEREFDIVRFEDTGIGDGFVVYVRNNGREQRVNCGSFQMREKIRNGHKRVELKFLSESDDGALRFPSVRRLV